VAIAVSLRRPAARMPVGPAAAGQDLQRRRVADPRADRAFQGGVDAGEQAADAVADPGGLAGQVVVEPDRHVRFGQGVVADVDRAQGVRQGAGGVGDDERVLGVGLRAARVEAGDAAHGQAGQVGHLVAGRTGHRDRQRADRGRLVDHHRQRPVGGELVGQRPQPRFAVGRWRVVQPLAGGSRPTAWCSPLPTPRPRNTW
jgi:hypothetical protein